MVGFIVFGFLVFLKVLHSIPPIEEIAAIFSAQGLFPLYCHTLDLLRLFCFCSSGILTSKSSGPQIRIVFDDNSGIILNFIMLQKKNT